MTPVMTPERTDKMRSAAELELARRWFLPFVKLTWPGYEAFPVHRVIATEIQDFVAAVERHESPRLMLFCQPRLGKSELTSRRGPPWMLGNHPDWNVGLVSYGADLAEELSGDARRIVMDDAFKDIFGALSTEDVVELDASSKAINHWRIKGRRGGLRAVGVGGALTGRGFDCLVIDDPLKGRKEADSQSVKDDLWKFWRGTLRSRVEPGGGILLIQTRWAVDDLAGRLLAADERRPPEKRRWRVVSIPTICEDPETDPLGRQRGEMVEGRFTEEELEELRDDISQGDTADQGRDEREWSAQYQQRPTPDSGAIFHPDEMFVFADQPTDYVGPRYMFADTSYARTRQSDYSAMGVWQLEPPGMCPDGVERRTLGLLDVYRKRAEFPDLKDDSRRMYRRYGVNTFVIEDYGSGKSLIQEFVRESQMRIKAWRPDADKIARAHTAANVMATYRVRLPRGATFPSGLPVQTYLKELREFGGGHATDDMVDMTTMAMILMGTFDVERRRAGRQMEYEFEMVV